MSRLVLFPKLFRLFLAAHRSNHSSHRVTCLEDFLLQNLAYRYHGVSLESIPTDLHHLRSCTDPVMYGTPGLRFPPAAGDVVNSLYGGTPSEIGTCDGSFMDLIHQMTPQNVILDVGVSATL